MIFEQQNKKNSEKFFFQKKIWEKIKKMKNIFEKKILKFFFSTSSNYI